MSDAAPATPFLERLHPEALELFLAAARPVSCLPGTVLVHHGDPARGAFILRAGEAEARIPAPGGETLVVARLAAGDIFGEMALVESGTCTATVVATGNVDGWFLACEDFRAVVAQRHAAARELQHAVTMVLAGRLRAVNRRLAAIASPEDRPAPVRAGRPGEGLAHPRRAAFDLAAFLPRLAFFEHFLPDEIDEFMAAGHLVEAPRDAWLHEPGAPSAAVWLVARGAVEIVRPAAGLERRVAVLGPGRLFGFLGVLEDEPHHTHAIVREVATLLQVAAADFRSLYAGERPVSVRVRAAVQRSLLESLARTNRALTRYASHARLAARRPEAAALEAAGAASLWTAGGAAPQSR